jgi:hypothetical protein
MTISYTCIGQAGSKMQYIRMHRIRTSRLDFTTSWHLSREALDDQDRYARSFCISCSVLNLVDRRACSLWIHLFNANPHSAKLL